MSLRALLNDLKDGHAVHNALSIEGILGMFVKIVDVLEPQKEEEKTHGNEIQSGQAGENGGNAGGQSTGQTDEQAGRFGFLETDQAASEDVGEAERPAAEALSVESHAAEHGPTLAGDDAGGSIGADVAHELAQWEGEGGKPVPPAGG